MGHPYRPLNFRVSTGVSVDEPNVCDDVHIYSLRGIREYIANFELAVGDLANDLGIIVEFRDLGHGTPTRLGFHLLGSGLLVVGTGRDTIKCRYPVCRYPVYP